MPYGQQIMWSIVRKLGISVEFITADFTDSVAAMAYHLKADILAKDWVLTNYYWDEGDDRRRRNCFNVFHHWKIEDGGFQFEKNTPWTKDNPMRAIPTSLPERSDTASPLDKIPASIHVGWTYIRGCGSNLTQVLNPHIKVISGHNIS